MDTGFSRRTNADRDIQPVAITSVDPVSRMATGITRIRNSIQINCAFAVGDAITVPAVGEQWYVERIDLEWRLYGRIPFNDATLNIEPEEGQVSVGSASGPLELNGTEVRSNGTVFRLNGVYYRDDGETLQRSVDKEVWEPISAQATGAIQLIGNALAGVPVTAEIVEYLENLSAEESDTLEALAAWASGLGEQLGSIWDGVCDSTFFSGLRGLGTGDTPVDQIVAGFQNFINTLWETLFCGFAGDLTPQLALDGLQGVASFFTDNPFIQGLASLLGDNAVGNLLFDAVTGATEFLQQVIDILFCNFTGDLTPQNILTAITDLLEPLIDNPFIQGLQSLADALGSGVGNLFTDAITGATNLFEAIFRAIFCDITGDLTPQNVIAKLTEVLASITDNPFVAGLISFAEGLGHTVGGGIEKAFAGANELLEQLFGIFFCDNEGVPTPQAILDSISGVVDLIRNNPLVSGLVTFIEGIGTTSTGFLTKAVEGAFEFFNQIVNTLFCNIPGQPTPTNILSSLTSIISSVTDNPYVAMLRALASSLGDTSTNLIQQIMAGITGIFDWFIDLLNTLVPFFDWNQIKTLNFPGMMSDLLNNLNPLAFLGLDGKLPFANLPEIAFSALTGLSSFLQDNIFGPLQEAILGGLNGTLTGGLAALNQFFDGALGVGGSLLQQIVNAMTGVGTFTSGPLATIQTLFNGITLGGGNLITQITDTLDEFVTNLDIATIVSKITGIDINELPNPLESLGQFFAGFSSFTGGNTLLAQVLTQAGSNLKPLIAGITGVAESAINDVVSAATEYFDNFRTLLGIDFGSAFNLPSARDALVSALNGATSGILDGSLIDSIGISQIAELVSFITGKISGAPADLQAMFTNLRAMFTGPGGVFTLLPSSGGFTLASAANSFITNVLSQATTAIGSVKIPALAIADLGVSQVSGLISSLTGGSTPAELTNFFANLRSMLNIGTSAGQINFMTGQTAESLQSALFSVIADVNNGLNSFLTQSGLSGWLGTDNISEIGNFFTNLVKFFDISSFKIDPASFDLSGTAGNFINDVINQATGSLISPLKILGVDSQDLLSSLSSRPMFADVVESITGQLSAVDLEPVSDLFSGLSLLSGATIVDKIINRLTEMITGFWNETSLTEFFGGLGGNLVTTQNSLVHQFVSSITGGSGTQTLSSLGTFFGSFSSSATTLVGKIVDHITGLITSGLSGMTLQNFFSGFNGVSAVSGSVAQVIAQSLGGSTVTNLSQVENLFTNLRTFLGIGTSGISLSDFVSDPVTFGTKLTEIINAFITNVLQKTGLSTTFVTLTNGATQLASDLIPSLSPEKITNLISSLTGPGTSVTDVSNFFANLRSFLGGSGFFSSPGSFSLGSAADNFITNVLRSPNTITRLVTLNAQNFIDSTIIPALDITKINNLTGYITGVGGDSSDIQKFFANLRSLFGSTNFLVSPGTFNLTTAANQFIVSVLSKATLAGIGSSRIAADVLSDFSVNKVTNLAKALTGQELSGATGDLLTIQRFFSGFTGFNPVDGTNNLIDQITEAVFGSSGTLAQLQSFFSGFTGFVPGTGANNLANQITKSITGNSAGALADISRFLGIGAANGGLLDFSGSNTETLVNQIVKKITGSGTSLTHLGNIFTNLRTALGFTGLDLHTGALTAGTLQNLVFNVIKNFNTGSGLNALITQDNLKSWLGGTATLTQIGNFFTNLKSFFGEGSIDLLSGTFSLTTAINNFVTNLLNQATDGLLSADLLPSLSVTKINNLISILTGGTTTAQLTNFFTNLRSAINHGTGTGQVNFTTTQSASSVRSALFNVIAGVNDGLGTSLNALITNSDLTGWLGGTTTAQIQTFFTNLKALLGGINLLPSGTFSAATEINKLFGVLNQATGTLNPSRVLSLAGGSTRLTDDLNARPLLTSLTTWLTADGTANNIQRLFTNLRKALGLNGVNLLSSFNLSTAQNALFSVITSVNNGLAASAAGKLATQALANTLTPINDLVKSITGGTGTYTNLTSLTSFFSGINALSGSNLLAKITYALTGSTTTNLTTFFSNLRSFLSAGGINLTSLNAATAMSTFARNLIGGDLIPSLNSYSLKLIGVPTSGGYRLSYGGSQTATINFDSSAATIESRLDSLSSIGSGNSTVTGSLGEGFVIAINNLTSNLTVSSNTLSGVSSPQPVLERQISPGIIPQLGVDWLSDIEEWAAKRLVVPIVSRLAEATGINVTGIDLVSDLDNGLTKLGSWAKSLVEGNFGIDSAIEGITKAALSVIPVSSIVDQSPNLLSQGAFAAPTNLVANDGWSWDGSQNNTGSSGGSAKVTISSAKDRRLYSKQAISVVEGDVLSLSAYVKTTSTFAGTGSPILLDLIIYNGNQYKTARTIATSAKRTSWGKISGNYTVLSGETSVIVRLRVNSTATAGSVWFDDVNLTKTGLLKQNLVDSLISVWQGMWNTVFGSGGSVINSSGTALSLVPQIINTVFGKASDGVDDASEADGKAQTVVDGIVQALTGSSSNNFLPTNVKTQLQSFFNILFGQSVPKSTLATNAIPNVTASMSTDLQGVFNNIVEGIRGISPGTDSPLTETFKAIDGQRQSFSSLSESVAELQTEADQGLVGGTAYTRQFVDFTNFNNNSGLYYIGSGTGSLNISNKTPPAYWSLGGTGEIRSAMGIMTSATTETTSQKVGINFSSAPKSSTSTAGKSYNYILANADSAGNRFVFVKFSSNTAALGYCLNGRASSPTETFFSGGQISHDFTPGATYYLETIFNGTSSTYRVTRNGSPIGLTVSNSTAYAYRNNSSYRYSGFKVTSGAYLFAKNAPGSMTSFSLNDNAPVPVIGSGLRRYRSGSPTGGDSNYTIPNSSVANAEYFLLPSGFFNSGTATSDYTYTTSNAAPNKIKVSVSGWYQVNINYGLVINNMNTDMAPVLYKNGSVFSKGASVWGVTSLGLGGTRGPSQCASSFIVYLSANEYIQPGYWQTKEYPNKGIIVADSDGAKTYIEMSLMNRSTK